MIQNLQGSTPIYGNRNKSEKRAESSKILVNLNSVQQIYFASLDEDNRDFLKASSVNGDDMLRGRPPEDRV